MNKRRCISVAWVFAFLVMFLFSSPLSLFAQEEKFELNKGYGIKEILVSYEGKRVALRLDSGEEVEGIVTKVGDQLVHLSKITKRDFYDALVRLDKINAIIFRARSN